MLCAAIDIGSNTTRVLVAEPRRASSARSWSSAPTRGSARLRRSDGAIAEEKIEEVPRSSPRRCGSPRSSAPSRSGSSRPRRSRGRKHQEVVHAIAELRDPVDVLSEQEEGRLSFIGATKALGHPVEGEIAVVDVGGGSSEVTFGTVAVGVSEVRSFRVGSGVLAEELIEGDRPGPAEIRKLRERIEDLFADVEIDHPDQAVAVGGSATSLRRLVGAVLEYETLERGIRVLTSDPAAEVAKRFELDPRRVEVLASGPPPRAVLPAPRPAAADRQGRPSGGRDPRDAARMSGLPRARGLSPADSFAADGKGP